MSYNHLPPQAYSKETLIQAYNWLRHQSPQIQELAKTTDMLISLFTKAQMHGDSYLNRSHMQTFKTELKSLANMMGEFDGNTPNLSGSTSQPSQSHKGKVKSKMDTAKNFPQNNESSIQPQQSSLSPENSNFSQTNGFKNGQMSSSFQDSLANTGALLPQTQQQPLPQLQQQQSSNNIYAQSNQQEESFSNEQTNSTLSTHPPVPASHGFTSPNTASSPNHLPVLHPSSSPSNVSHQTLPHVEEILKSQLDMKSWAMIQEVKNYCNLSSEAEALRLIVTIGYNKIKSQF